MARNYLAVLLATLALPGIAGASPPAACAACHGANGQGNRAAGYPSLAGQSARYLYWQLRDFSDGSRKSTVMRPIARSLTDAKMKALAAHYAALPSPVAPRPAKPPDSLGYRIATDGVPHPAAAATPACDFCHGAAGAGAGPFPRLAGQPASYLAAQIAAWRNGSRAPGPLGIMGHIARDLSRKETLAVARYYAALPTR
ncbi:MAG: c-type cytochrome [Acidiphilium sp.]